MKVKEKATFLSCSCASSVEPSKLHVKNVAARGLDPASCCGFASFSEAFEKKKKCAVRDSNP